MASLLQNFIVRCLDTQGVTRYRLGQRCGYGSSIYRRLNEPILHRSLEKMLAAIGATIAVPGESVTLGLDHEGNVITVDTKGKE